MEVDISWVAHQHYTDIDEKLEVGDSVRSIVFDDEEP